MKTKTSISTKVFFSTALGSLIGTIVSLELPDLFWILGLAIGGLVGYLSYEFKTVLEAIPKAWKAVVGWRIDKTKAKRKFAYALLSVSLVFYMLLIYLGMGGFSGTGDFPFSYRWYIYLIFIAIGLITIFYFVCIPINEAHKNYPDDTFNEKIHYYKTGFILKFCNPIVAPFAGLIWFGKIIIKHRAKIYNEVKNIIVGILRFIFITFWVKTYQFFRFIFRYVHNDIRIICFVDAMIGTWIGYNFGSPIIGCFSGGILGVVNYYIVSIKIMKLKPSH
jgi:hypothetical protein